MTEEMTLERANEIIHKHLRGDNQIQIEADYKILNKFTIFFMDYKPIREEYIPSPYVERLSVESMTIEGGLKLLAEKLETEKK